jgi:hypothetical protein
MAHLQESGHRQPDPALPAHLSLATQNLTPRQRPYCRPRQHDGLVRARRAAVSVSAYGIGWRMGYLIDQAKYDKVGSVTRGLAAFPSSLTPTKGKPRQPYLNCCARALPTTSGLIFSGCSTTGAASTSLESTAPPILLPCPDQMFRSPPDCTWPGRFGESEPASGGRIVRLQRPFGAVGMAAAFATRSLSGREDRLVEPQRTFRKRVVF